jgi:hypothetical protein
LYVNTHTLLSREMKLKFCVACGTKDNLHHHHLKPRSLGGTDDETNLITLCQTCHGIYHNISFRDHGWLTRKGLERAKAKGVKLGNPKAQEQGIEARKQSERLLPILDQLIVEGNRSLYSLANTLNERGITTPQGKKFYPQSVADRFKYLGYTLADYLEQHHPHPTNGSPNQKDTL